MDAFLEIGGVEQPVDSGAGDPGVFWYPASVDPTTMTRSFAMREYWAGTAQERDNYETVLGQKVLRVLFDGDTATGVEYVDASATDDSAARTVTARKEVVMAAGTLYTPQILQASGVGPREWLEAAGVEVVADLPGSHRPLFSSIDFFPMTVSARLDLLTWNQASVPISKITLWVPEPSSTVGHIPDACAARSPRISREGKEEQKRKEHSSYSFTYCSQ